MSTDVICPYCEKEQDINHDDGYGYQEGVTHNQQCGFCNKYFVFQTSISFDYEVDKAACLNDGPHDFQPTRTFPKEYTEMECVACSETRKPTPEEKQKYSIPEIVNP